MQDRLKGEIEQISKRHKEAMWNEINYFERPDERPEHEKHRITNITGGWRKDNRFEYETTGYDSDRPSFTGDSDPDTD